MPKLQIRTTDTAYRITLDAPPLHILDIELLTELRDALASVKNDRHLLVIDSTGQRAFCAGASVQDHIGERVVLMLNLFHECFRILNRLELASVAIVQGAALGGGCELALGCDFVVASERATFGQPEINLGVFPPVAAYQLSRQTTPRAGLELLLSGEPIDAAEAHRLGLINKVLPAEGFQSAAEQWLGRFERQSASSLRFAKRAFRLAATDEFDERLARVERLYLEELMKTADANEGLEAFVAKRRPEWRHA